MRAQNSAHSVLVDAVLVEWSVINFPCPVHPNWWSLESFTVSNFPHSSTGNSTLPPNRPESSHTNCSYISQSHLYLSEDLQRDPHPADIRVYVHVRSLLCKGRCVCCVSLASLLPIIKKKCITLFYSAYTDVHTSKQRC